MEATLKLLFILCSLFLFQFAVAQTPNLAAGKIETTEKSHLNHPGEIDSPTAATEIQKTSSKDGETISEERTKDLLTQPSLEVFTGLHQMFYQAALFLGILALFYFQLKFLHFLAALILGFIASFIYPLDKYVHELFIQTHFYRVLGVANFEQNDQYGKLFVYALVIFALCILLFLRKKPKLFSLITLLLLVVNLLVVAINHFSLPNGFYKDVLNDRKELLLGINSKSMDARLDSCKEFKIVCLEISNIQDLDTQTLPFGKNEKEEVKIHLIRNFATLGAFAFIQPSNSPSILAVLKTHDRILLAYDAEYPLLQWRRAEGYFSRASFFVSCGWYFLALALCFMHGSPARMHFINYFRRSTLGQP